MNIQEEVEKAIRQALADGVRSRLTGSYNNPLDKIISDSLAPSGGQFRVLLEESITGAINDPEFRESIRAAVRSTLAKTLVQRFGGELEKQVNALKSDPITRARITLALEEIVKTTTSPAG